VPKITVFEQQAFRPAQALSAAIASCQPAFIAPGDDRAVANLHHLHRNGSEAERRLIERSLGSPAGFATAMSRLRLLAVARRLGIAVPDDQPVATAGDLQKWIERTPGPWVLKADGSWAGTGVRIASTPQAAHAAFRALSRHMNGRTALTRMLINRDRFSASDWLRRDRQQIIVQRHVGGWPGNLAMLCRDGEVLAVSVAEAVAWCGATGPSTIVRLVERPDFVDGARRLARELMLNGFHGLDFMVDQSTGQALLIELNPRLTPLAGIRAEMSQDLVGTAATLLSGVACRPPSTLPSGEFIAHFPGAWQWHRDDPRLAACFHDAPWEEPALMAEMLRPSWPERPLLARLEASLRRLVRRSRSLRLRARPAPPACV